MWFIVWGLVRWRIQMLVVVGAVEIGPAAAEQDKLENAVQHRNLEFDRSKDLKTDRVMKRLAGRD
jgi:hypothetical protein